jgi:hypothetical protein
MSGSTLAVRKAQGIEQKLAALDAEFQEWLGRTEANAAFEKHHTQVRALTGHLEGLRNKTTQIFRAGRQNDVLAQARNLESLILGIRRIWEFFRSKLIQRRDDDMRTFLQLADELAWKCYKPVIDIAGPKARREPPLVFLNGGLSPYALTRDEAFAAEAVPGEVLAGRTWDPILQRLPVPVIGVPWHQTAHIPDLPVVAHEAGHVVEQDFGWHETVTSNIDARLKGSPGTTRAGHWKAWSKEIFADLWGCLALGPAFVNSLMDFLALAPQVVDGEIATEQGKYPTAHLRIQLCLEALKTLGFDSEIPAIETAWRAEFKAGAMSGFEKDVAAIVEAIYASDFEIDGKKWRLPDIPALQFKVVDWGYAQDAANEQKRGKVLESATTAALLVAAARFSFDQDPTQYRTRNYGDAFKSHIHTIVAPGVRAGEAKLSDQEKRELSDASRAAGEAWFEDFAQWVGNSRQLSMP